MKWSVAMNARGRIEDEVFAHRANITRYERILVTHLRPEEREFIERQLSEEQAALARLTGAGSQ